VESSESPFINKYKKIAELAKTLMSRFPNDRPNCDEIITEKDVWYIRFIQLNAEQRKIDLMSMFDRNQQQIDFYQNFMQIANLEVPSDVYC
jgi:hypothetical protein